jgi:hypothetical protein
MAPRLATDPTWSPRIVDCHNHLRLELADRELQPCQENPFRTYWLPRPLSRVTPGNTSTAESAA